MTKRRKLIGCLVFVLSALGVWLGGWSDAAQAEDRQYAVVEAKTDSSVTLMGKVYSVTSSSVMVDKDGTTTILLSDLRAANEPIEGIGLSSGPSVVIFTASESGGSPVITRLQKTDRLPD